MPVESQYDLVAHPVKCFLNIEADQLQWLVVSVGFLYE
jgi:hypothetical protein